MTKPTKEQFEEYKMLSDKGFANLFDGRYICEMSKTGLTQDICICIQKHFDSLEKEFSTGC
jgi:hypothetical protein